MKRVVFDILLLISLFLLPWWVSALFACVGIFLFIQFYEFVGVGVIIYSLYTVPENMFITKPFWFAGALCLVYVGIQILREYLIVYKL